MDLVQLVFTFILGLQPQARPNACDRTFINENVRLHCIEVQKSEYARFQSLAESFVIAGSVYGLDPFLFPAWAQKESWMEEGELCLREIPASRVTFREEVEGASHMTRFHWVDVFGVSRTVKAKLVREANNILYLDKCGHGEIGIFQIRDGTYEVPRFSRNYLTQEQINYPGTDRGMPFRIPITNEEIPSTNPERRLFLLDPRRNTYLATRAMAFARTEQCCTLSRSNDGATTQVCDNLCMSDWRNYLGMYNTGSTERTLATPYGRKWLTYRRRILRNYNQGMRYLCHQIPDAYVCATWHDPRSN